MGDIRIGTSGFSYEGWKGFLYSETTKKSDMLAYYARHFSTVEVNSTYYAIPSPITFERMLSKVPDDFEFAVKAHQDITHAPQLESSTVQTFNRAIRPLIDAGRHGCILAQFLWSFRCTSDGVARIRLLRDRMDHLPLIVEFKNSEWVSEEAFDFLRKHNLGFCCVDEPACKGLMHRISVVTSPIGYMRFHGRNASK